MAKKKDKRAQTPAPARKDEKFNTAGVALAVVGLLIVVALTGLFGDGHTQLGDFLSRMDTMNALRIVGGVVIVVLAGMLVLRLRARSAEEGEGFFAGIASAVHDPLNGRAWVEVVLILLVGIVMIVWGVTETF